jgi:hypothetical protein
MMRLQFSQICDGDLKSFTKGESDDDLIVFNLSLQVAVRPYTVLL